MLTSVIWAATFGEYCPVKASDAAVVHHSRDRNLQPRDRNEREYCLVKTSVEEQNDHSCHTMVIDTEQLVAVLEMNTTCKA